MSSIKDIIKESLINFSNSLKETYTKKNDIIDNLDSTDTDKPLSANMGNNIKNQIDTLNSNKTEIKDTMVSTSTDEYGICGVAADKKVISAFVAGYIVIPFVVADGSVWKFKIVSTSSLECVPNANVQLLYRYFD